MELPQEDKKKQYDFVSSLASKALDVDSRTPAGKAVEEAQQQLKAAKQAGDVRYANETNRAVKIANNVQKSLSPEEQSAAAAGLDGAKKLIEEYRSLKGFTYRDLLEAGGYNKEVQPQSMGNAELMTRLSMAILPALAGYAVGKMGGMSNPYIPATGAAEAGVKGLQYLDQLDKEKRDRAAKQKEMQAKAAMAEATDERKMMREALLMPQKERLRAQELAAQFKLTVGKEAADTALKGRVATDEEKQAELALREAKRMEFDAAEKAKDRSLNEQQRALDRAAKLKAAGMKKKDNLSVSAEAYVRKVSPILATRSKTISAIDAVIEQLDNPNISDEQKVLAGNSLLKPMNDPDNPDALQQAEAARLDPYLKFQMFNVLPGSPGKAFGRDLGQFKKQLELTRERLQQGYGTLRSEVESVEQTGALPHQAPRPPSKDNAPPPAAGFIKPTADLLGKLSADEKRKYIQGDMKTQQELLKKAAKGK